MNLKRFHNIHLNDRVFIACNGSSLNDIDVTKLAGEKVFILKSGIFEKWNSNNISCIN